jgi:hypothetical protein
MFDTSKYKTHNVIYEEELAHQKQKIESNDLMNHFALSLTNRKSTVKKATEVDSDIGDELANYVRTEGVKWMSLSNPDRYKDCQLKEQAMALVVPGHLKYVFGI